jgi:hypothetical protein
MTQSSTMTLSGAPAIPRLAPLPIPIARHLVGRQRKERRPPETVALTLEEQLAQATRHFDAFWLDLEQAVREKRVLTYTLLSPIVDTPGLSTDWVWSALKNYTDHPVTVPTISRWREQKLLRYDGWNQPAADSVASLLIARLIDPRERGWLPHEMKEEEPRWWCWRQDAPGAPAVPCPVPLPEDLPPATLLWTPWAGAAWDPGWLNVGTAGAIRWAGTTIQHGKLLWNITEDDLQRWDPGVFPLAKGILEMASEVLHMIATMALARLARERLGQTAALASSPP